MFYVVFTLLLMQRLLELRVAKRNQAWMEQRGGIEIGAGHYPLMVLLHVGFLISLWGEAAWRGYPLSAGWPLIGAALLIIQAVRYWAIVSLGPYWNTRILFVPGAEVVQRGPYRFLRHPNYTVVALEIALFPLLFQAYVTCVLFSLLNAAMLRHRIRVEEQGLIEYTDYAAAMGRVSRYIPKVPEEK
ncbi:isoprenylcysteine carboxyl methyltransferase [Aneurinibacillus sp. BA2021]|nr:isoprenylcysteine carboxyl methyltransferase [Aneurinibacillus sp. BA2021]